MLIKRIISRMLLSKLRKKWISINLGISIKNLKPYFLNSEVSSSFIKWPMINLFKKKSLSNAPPIRYISFL